MKMRPERCTPGSDSNLSMEEGMPSAEDALLRRETRFTNPSGGCDQFEPSFEFGRATGLLEDSNQINFYEHNVRISSKQRTKHPTSKKSALEPFASVVCENDIRSRRSDQFRINNEDWNEGLVRSSTDPEAFYRSSVDPDQKIICSGCGKAILEQYYLVTSDRQWHTSGCLRCTFCDQSLNNEHKCFVSNEKIYCRQDYYRLFGPKCCSRCSKSISGEELVMKTGLDVFHVNCFACSTCDRQLTTGQHYGIYDRLIYCQPHYEEILTTNQSQKPHFDGTSQTPADLKENSRGGGGGGNLSPFASAVSTADANSSPPYIPRQPIACGFNGSNTSGKIRSRKRKVCLPDSIPNPFGQTKFSMNDISFSDISDIDLQQHGGYGIKDGGYGIKDGCHGQGNRQKRMRTSFKHHQLRAMKAYFAINHNPDAKDLKELAQKTGLTKRVLQVWFQNARAKYRRNVLKQEVDKHSEGTTSVVFKDRSSSSAANQQSSRPQTPDISDDSTPSIENNVQRDILDLDQSTSGSAALDIFESSYIDSD